MTHFEQEMEKELLKLEESIRSKIEKTDDDFRGVVSANGIRDSADLATEDMVTRKMETISQLDANKLNAVRQALIRIKNGKYGTCAICGKPIPEERLRAIPYAMLCLNCKNVKEKNSR